MWKAGLGGLGVPYSPPDSRFSGSNPAQVDGFVQDLKILSTSPPGGTLGAGGPESEISCSLKNLKPEKIGLCAKFNRHIHVLVIPKLGEHNRFEKGRSILGSNDHPIKTIQYNKLFEYKIFRQNFKQKKV